MTDKGDATTAVAPQKLLRFQRKIVTELTQPAPLNDGLVVVAKGLGLSGLLLTFVALHADPRALVLLLNTTPGEVEFLKRDLQALGKADMVNSINNETPAPQRVQIYLKGGVLSITTRILIVDMLNKRIPVDLVTGILINHAHRITEISPEAFILRLYRNENQQGFIRAFSDEPESFASGIWKLEKSMKVLYQRHVHLWPRFHVQVKHDIEKHAQVDMVELRIPMTQSMKEIQQGLWECLDQCLAEIKRSNPSLHSDDYTVENASFRAFDYTIRSQLEPNWHRVSGKTKNLLQDLKTIRKLLGYMSSYDCVTFYSFLETLVAAAAPTTVFKTEPSSPWLMLDAAQIVIASARKRVYRQKKKKTVSSSASQPVAGVRMEPVLEEQPKWKILLDVIKEIHEEKAQGDAEGPILIMVQEDRTCYHLAEILCSTNYTVIHHHPNAKFPDITEQPDRRDSEFDFSTSGIQNLMDRLLKNYLKWKGSLNQVMSNIQPKDAQRTSSTAMGDASTVQRGQPPNKRRRARGGTTMSTSTRGSEMVFDIADEAEQLHDLLSQIQNPIEQDEVVRTVTKETANTIDSDKTIYVRTYSASAASVSGSLAATGQDDARVLQTIKPRWIIMYDADLGFIRRLELYKAANPSQQMKVFFMVYDNSVEERRYLSLIRKERSAFEKLIREKSNMAVPVDQDGRTPRDTEDVYWNDFDTRIGRGGAPTVPTVIVDLREFRCSLPSLLHARRLIIQPCTLEVGDYIVSPTMCVERKSLPDLVQSLKSGRLYTQAEAMCIHYSIPILLIEFDRGKSFSLSISRDEPGLDTASRLILLCIHFPKLRIIWSPSPKFSAEIFEELKVKQAEPDMEKAMEAGVDNQGEKDTDYNITPSDILQSLPGVNKKNSRFLMSRFTNLRELTEAPLETFQELIGVEPGRKLHDFIHHNEKST